MKFLGFWKIKKQEDLLDNMHATLFKDALALVKANFAGNMHFRYLDQYVNPAGYWRMDFLYKNLYVSLIADRGCLEHEVKRNDQTIRLSEYDVNVNAIVTSSKTNLVYLINLIKRIA